MSATANTPRRAVITGLGVIAPTGIGADVYWKATREGIGALDRITRDGCTDLPVRIAGEVRGFDAEAVVEGRYRVQTDRFTHFAMYATELALADAAVDPARLPEYAVGVVTAAGSGGGEFGQRELQRLWAQGPRHVGPYQSIAWFYAASTGQISIRHGLKGPCGVLASDEPGGLDALAHARRSVRRGTDVVAAGAAEAPLAPYSAVCQLGYPELSTAADPGRAYTPFADTACGFAPAEGGAILVVEDAGHAAARGARARAEIAGHAATFTGSGPWAASREGLARAITGALDDAGLAPDDIDVVVADALGVPEADLAEARALHDALGPHAARVPVTAPKAGSGRAYCGAAVLDVATAVLVLEHGVVPPTPYVTRARDELGIDLVTGSARATAPRTVLVLARGLMGGNSAMVLRIPEPFVRHRPHGPREQEHHLMDGPLTLDELAAMMQSCAGVAVDKRQLRDRPEITFEQLGLDSLGLLGVVAEVENRYGSPLGPDLERTRRPAEFVELVNAQMSSGV